MAADLVSRDEQSRLCREFAREFDALAPVLSRIAWEKSFTPHAQDQLLGVGESLSSKLVHAALKAERLEAALVDARECIVTDAAHTRATPFWDDTNRRLQALLLPLAELWPDSGDGWICGRHARWYPNHFRAWRLRLQCFHCWRRTARQANRDLDRCGRHHDHRSALCPDATRVPRMSFDEAADLAYFGAKVLHPATLVPAMRSGVPVWVLNSRNPDCPGTEIVAHCETDGRVKAVTSKRGVAIVDIEPVRWFAPELLREVFDVFERHQHSLDLLSASRGSLALLVSSVTALPSIAEELKGMANVRWENHKALVCLVGDQIRRRPEIAGQAFRAISDIDVRMICQGASERNISFLVDESRAVEAVQRLHRSFFSIPVPEPVLAASSSQAMCQAEGAW